MPDTVDGERASGLYRSRDYPALVALLESAPRHALLDSPELGFMLADSLWRIGRGAEALEQVRELVEVCAYRGNDWVGRNVTNLEGMIRFGRGEVAAAEACWAKLRRDAADAGDDEYAARANHNLGVVHTLRGAETRALTSYERAIVAYGRLGSRRGLAQVHHNLAITYRELDYFRRAEAHFTEAMAYARTAGSMDEVARVVQERALLVYYASRDALLASLLATRSLESFRSLGFPADQGESLRVLGTIHFGEARHAEATVKLEAALAIARERQLPLLEAETTEVLAAVAERVRDTALAARRRNRASALFSELGAVDWGTRIRRRIAAVGRGSPFIDREDVGAEASRAERIGSPETERAFRRPHPSSTRE